MGAAALVALVSLAITSTTLAANLGPTQLLRKISADSPLFITGVAAKGKYIATAWTENFQPYVRWSTNGGPTFRSRVGANANSSASIDICAGYVWAVTDQPGFPADEPPPLKELNIHIDGWRLDGTAHRQRTLHRGTAYGDLACIGDRALATVWEREVDGGQHASLGIWTITGNGRLTRTHAFDLGPADEIVETSVAATNTAIHVAWMDGKDLRLKTVDLGPGPDPTATGRAWSLRTGTRPRCGCGSARTAPGPLVTTRC